MTYTFLSRAAAAALAVLAAASGAGAQSAATLAASQLAVTGRVAGIESRWDTASQIIVTYVDIDVERSLRGAAPRRITLKQLGGRVGGIGLFIAGQASFQPDEHVLLLLSVSPRDGTLHTTGLERGKLPVDAETLARVETELAGRPFAVTTPYVASPPERETGAMTPMYSFLPVDGGGPPARWHEVDDDGVVWVDHPSSMPGGWSGSAANATAAVALWRASGMELDLRDAGASIAPGVCPAGRSDAYNGRIRISYNDPCGVADTPETWVIGGGYYTTGDLRTVNGEEFQKFLQGFVVLNNVGPQTGSEGCFQDAITHGLGHAMGLGHSDSGGAMMNALPSASCSSGPRGLCGDDVAGITAIYQGIASGPFPPDAPTALNASSSLSTVMLSWTPASSGGPASRYIVDAGTMSGVYNIGSILLNSAATSTAIGSVPPGTYFVRVRAQNAAGTSGQSPEAQVTVGACVPPGAPGTLSANAVNTSVSLQWSAPAGGVIQGYRFMAGSAPGLSNVLVQDYPAAVTSLGAAGVPYGTYYARVAATNVCGTGPASNEVTILVQPCAGPPQAPTGLHFSRTGTVVALAWTAPAAGPPPTSYLVVVGSQTGGSNILVHSTGSTATSLGASAPPGTYYVRILAQNACGLSGASNEIVVGVP